MKLKPIKDRLKNETLDLSLCDLNEVPVREIATIRKATHLDLSNNLLVSLPTTFVTLKQIVKLDLSKNMLTEIPDNFGEMTQLKHLDLYANQISRLPLSLSELKNLRWLDLKENPLTPAVASVAGPCSNLVECQACARNIVAYLSNVKLSIAEEKLRRLNAIDADPTSLKKAEKKKKKKPSEKESKKVLKNGSENVNEILPPSDSKDKEPLLNYGHGLKEGGSPKGKSGRGFFQTLFIMASWTLFLLLAVSLALAIFSVSSKQNSELFIEYVETRTGLPLMIFQKQSNETLHLSMKVIAAWTKSIYESLSDVYKSYFNMNANVSASKK